MPVSVSVQTLGLVAEWGLIVVASGGVLLCVWVVVHVLGALSRSGDG